MIRPTLSIDPGKDGGGVELDMGRRVRSAWKWRTRDRKAGRVVVLEAIFDPLQSGGSQHVWELPNVAAVGRTIATTLEGMRRNPLGRYCLVVEGLFVPRNRDGKLSKKAFLGRVRHTVTLGETTGMIMGPLLPLAGEVLRPTAAEWRPLVLGLKRNVSSKIAEDVAKRACSPASSSPLVVGLGYLGDDPYVCEAACMGRFGHSTQFGRST